MHSDKNSQVAFYPVAFYPSFPLYSRITHVAPPSVRPSVSCWILNEKQKNRSPKFKFVINVFFTSEVLG